MWLGGEASGAAGPPNQPVTIHSDAWDDYPTSTFRYCVRSQEHLRFIQGTMEPPITAHADTSQPFDYNSVPLSKSSPEIRLLELLPSPDRTALLTCRIFLSALPTSEPESAPELKPPQRHDSHPYTALSYVWGIETKTRFISAVAGLSSSDEETDSVKRQRRLAITQSLHTALVHLRDEREKVVLWIDQICINQEDEVEKGYQVCTQIPYRRSPRLWIASLTR